MELGIFNPKETNFHSNRIINGRQEFSVIEKKMIYCIINQLDANMNVQQDLFDNMYFKIPISTFGADYNYATLKDAIKKITTRTITGGNDKKGHFFSITPLPFAEVKNGVVRLLLLSEAVPYFIDLKKHGYTSYQLEAALSLTSVYSQRLFELLSRWKDTGKWFGVEIAHLKFLLGIDKKKGYVQHSNLVNIILEPAKAELAEKTDIEFDYSFEKQGRKFYKINFNIYTKKLLQHLETLDAKENARDAMEQLAEAPKTQQMVFFYQALAQYNFDEKQKKQILGNQKLITKFIEIHTHIMTGAVKVETTPTRLMAWHLRQNGLK